MGAEKGQGREEGQERETARGQRHDEKEGTYAGQGSDRAVRRQGRARGEGEQVTRQQRWDEVEIREDKKGTDAPGSRLTAPGDLFCSLRCSTCAQDD